MQERRYFAVAPIGAAPGLASVPYRKEGAMPGTTIALNGAQRDDLYELIRNHLGSVGDL